VTQRNALPHAKPRILHHYYMTEDDTRTIIEGTRVALEIPLPACLRKLRTADWAVPESGSDADILRVVRHNTRSIFHPVGTCGRGGVVDAELRAHGVESLTRGGRLDHADRPPGQHQRTHDHGRG